MLSLISLLLYCENLPLLLMHVARHVARIQHVARIHVVRCVARILSQYLIFDTRPSFPHLLSRLQGTVVTDKDFKT